MEEQPSSLFKVSPGMLMDIPVSRTRAFYVQGKKTVDNASFMQ